MEAKDKNVLTGSCLLDVARNRGRCTRGGIPGADGAYIGTDNGREYHVAATGDDANAGTQAKPFKTIRAAANLCNPGDVITVHEGIYRERVNPPRGGTSDRERIAYQAAPGEKVVITGSEIVKHWQRVANDTWKAIIPNAFFGSFNPYSDLVRGDWYAAKGRQLHTGSVYRNGEWLREATKLDDAMSRPPSRRSGSDRWTTPTRRCAQFPGGDPNDGSVEIGVRKTVFTPEKTGHQLPNRARFTMRNAATNWSPPSAGQIGLVSAYWNKGWIIENNEISYSKCAGLALGKYSDKFDNTNKAGGT